MNTASFGWEINSINGKGANMLIPVKKAITLTSFQASISMMSLSPSAGASEVFVAAFVFPKPPVFDNTDGHAFMKLEATPDIGPASWYDPNGIKPHGDASSHKQDCIFTGILKTYAPASTCQNFQVPHELPIAAGSTIVLHMDHWGVTCDVEMDGSITYEPDD